MTSDSPGAPPSAASVAAGVDHVRLSYFYQDAGDLDAYASLLHEDVQLNQPGNSTGHGRAEAVKLLDVAGRHELYKVVAEGDCVVAVGRYSSPTAPRRHGLAEFDFADFFTLSDDALLLSRRRFYYLPPPAVHR
ncbi:MAG TPA: nuclear transport factor 2 family protein [Umezawaea sp.]|nr:nuclear transport factor 2 family protein [Umezawaea sp.]